MFLQSVQLQKKLQPQVVAGALACIDLVCSAGFEERYASGANGEKRNKTLYTCVPLEMFGLSQWKVD